MTRRSLTVLLLAAVLVPLCFTSIARAQPLEDGATQLFFAGGPAPYDIEVTLNGEYLTTITEDVQPSLDVSEMLAEGSNELRLKFIEPDEPRESTNELQVMVTPISKSTSRQFEMGAMRAFVSIPPDLADAAIGCEEIVPFSVAVPGLDGGELENTYYLTIHGPQSTNRVNVSINGHLVVSTHRMMPLIDVTPFVKKGRNEAIFESAPSCMPGEDPRGRYLRFEIGTGERHGSRIELESPLTFFDLNPKKDKPVLKKRPFRGR